MSFPVSRQPLATSEVNIPCGDPQSSEHQRWGSVPLPYTAVSNAVKLQQGTKAIPSACWHVRDNTKIVKTLRASWLEKKLKHEHRLVTLLPINPNRSLGDLTGGGP